MCLWPGVCQLANTDSVVGLCHVENLYDQHRILHIYDAVKKSSLCYLLSSSEDDSMYCSVTRRTSSNDCVASLKKWRTGRRREGGRRKRRKEGEGGEGREQIV